MANTETVEIIIEGTDNSATAFATAEMQLSKLGNTTKGVGASLGKLARVAGLGEFAGYAGQIKDAGEGLSGVVARLNQGVVSSAALKAGLAAVVGVVAFKLTDSIARWALDIDDLIAKAESARAELEAAGDRYREGLGAELEAKREIAKLTNSEAESYNEIAAAMAKQQSEVSRLKAERDKFAMPTVAEKLPGTTWKEQREGHLKTAEALYQNELATLQIYQKQLQAMGDMTPVQKQLAELKADQAASKKRQQDEADYWKLVAEQEKASEARSKELADVFKDVSDAFDAIAGDDKDWAVIDNLKLAQVELEQGEDAAYRMSLAMQGISEPAIDAAVAIRQQNEALEEQKRVKDSILGDAGSIMQRMLDDEQNAGKAAPSLSAKESRFLTRGTAGGDPQAKIAKTTEEMKKIAEKALAEAKANRESAERQEKLLEVTYEQVGS